MPRPYSIFAHLRDSSACTYYRVALPYDCCSSTLAGRGVFLHTAGFDPMNDPGEFDCYCFQRDVNQYFVAYAMMLKRMGKKVVWDVDDDMFNIPAWNPASKGMTGERVRALTKVFNEVDVITVTTARLRDSFPGHWAAKTVVLPNLVHTGHWPGRDRRDDGVVRVVWAGGRSHGADLDLIAETVGRVAWERNGSVRFYFLGTMPSSLMPSNENTGLASKVVFINPVNIHYYHDALRLINPDVGLCPLVDDTFNRGKSAIKFYEMTLAGAASILSPVGPFLDVANAGNALFAADGGWYDCINALVDNTTLRSTLVGNAGRDVRRLYSWQSPEPRLRWLNFYLSLAGLDPVDAAPPLA
jgi:glycosyltransferase involved in cell wall biosynthesis